MQHEHDLGLPRRRDPDALPPRNWIEVVMNLVYHFVESLTSGNSVFAFKAGLVSGTWFSRTVVALDLG